MAGSGSAWPHVGDAPKNINAHAQSILKDLDALANAAKPSHDKASLKAVPYVVFDRLTTSVRGFVNKATDQPSSRQLVDVMKQLQVTTDSLLGQIKSPLEILESLKALRTGSTYSLRL